MAHVVSGPVQAPSLAQDALGGFQAAFASGDTTGNSVEGTSLLVSVGSQGVNAMPKAGDGTVGFRFETVEVTAVLK